MSATPDSTLANPEQRIADLERQLAEREAELAECQAERDQGLQRETATADVLRIINNAPGDLDRAFTATLKNALQLCDASYGHIVTYDGERFATVVTRGETLPPEWTNTLGVPFTPVPGGPLHRIIEGEDSSQVVDIADTDAFRAGDPTAHDLVEITGAHTVLAAAFRHADALLGAVVIYRQEVRPFTDKQIALLENFAAQAVIAMENARQLTETREALEQQTATAEVLQVINSSPGDLAPVFDAILEKAHTLCGATRGALVTYDGERFRAIATRGLPEAFAEVMRRGSPLLPGPLDPLVRGEQFVHIPDLAQFAAESGPEVARFVRPAVEIARTRTTLMVPLRKNGTLLGYIGGYRTEVRRFSNRQIALLQNFAAQAVIAMDNARLITETREALAQQTATAEVLQVINSSPGDLAPVFDTMLEKAMHLCEAAFGVLRTYDGERLNAVAMRGVPDAYTDFAREPLLPGPQTGLGRILYGESLVHIADIRDDEVYRSGDKLRVATVELAGARTLLLVALRKDDALLGIFAVFRQEVRPFTDKQIALLQNFAAQAVIAMENARLLGELRQRTDEVAELNRGLEARVAEQVNELGRVGRLKRFLAPQLAELIVSQGDEHILESHRREIVVVFCDLRGYTPFTETAEPEDQFEFLRQYHGALGPLITEFEGTLDHFSGDGIMVFFNDPVPCSDPAERAVKMAMAMREAAGKLIATWLRDGCELGFGSGIAQGYATLGQIGFFERSGYTAIGTVCNLAARLCAEAKDGQILISSRVARAVEAVASLEDLGNLELRGFRRPVAAFNVVQSTSAADARPNLTVVATGPGA